MSDRTLLIFDWFGEADLGLYLLPDAPGWLAHANGHVQGCVGSEEAEGILARISDAICEKDGYYDDPDDELAGAWVRYKLKPGDPIPAGSDVRVITCGWCP